MEIGNDGIQTLELIAGIDKDAGVSAACMGHMVFIGRRLNGAAGGRSDTDDPTSPLTRSVDLGRGTNNILFLRNIK